MNRFATLSIAVALLSCSSPSKKLPAYPTQPAALEATVMELPTFPSGDSASLETLKGKVVLIDVWATWCSPCREALPELQGLADRNADKDVAFVTINIDEDASLLEEYIGQLGLRLPVWRDPGARLVASRLRFTQAPSSYLIDQQGTVRVVHAGYAADSMAVLQRQIDKLLAEEEER